MRKYLTREYYLKYLIYWFIAVAILLPCCVILKAGTVIKVFTGTDFDKIKWQAYGVILTVGYQFFAIVHKTGKDDGLSEIYYAIAYFASLVFLVLLSLFIFFNIPSSPISCIKENDEKKYFGPLTQSCDSFLIVQNQQSVCFDNCEALKDSVDSFQARLLYNANSNWALDDSCIKKLKSDFSIYYAKNDNVFINTCSKLDFFSSMLAKINDIKNGSNVEIITHFFEQYKIEESAEIYAIGENGFLLSRGPLKAFLGQIVDGILPPGGNIACIISIEESNGYVINIKFKPIKPIPNDTTF